MILNINTIICKKSTKVCEESKKSCNSVVRDPFHYDRTYKVLEIIENANPETLITKEFIDDIQSSKIYQFQTQEKYKTIKGLYKTTFKFQDEINQFQPLILATKIPYPNECLVIKSSSPTDKSQKVVLLLPQSCNLTGFDADFLSGIGYRIPLIMQKIEDELRVRDYQIQTGLTQVPRSRFRTALTTKSMRYVYDYERSEMLGDSFLKFTQS